MQQLSAFLVALVVMVFILMGAGICGGKIRAAIDPKTTLIIYTLLAYFSLYVAQFLNRLDKIYSEMKLKKDALVNRKKVLDAWDTLFIAHVAFTCGVVLPPLFLIYFYRTTDYETAIEIAISFGLAFFCAGYSALVVMSVWMLKSHFEDWDNYSRDLKNQSKGKQ